MADQLRMAFQDFDGDAQTTSFLVEDVTAAGGYAAFDAQTGALAVQLDAWSIGRSARQDYVLNVVDNGAGRASSPVAQSSTQLILEIEDAVNGKIFKERLPFPDLTKAADGGGEPAFITTGQGSQSLTVVNPLHTGWASLKAAYDACGKTPDGNDGILIRAYIEE